MDSDKMRRLTGRADAAVERHDTDAVEVIQSRNARSAVETGALAGGTSATRRSAVLGHADHRQRRVDEILHQRSALVDLQIKHSFSRQ